MWILPLWPVAGYQHDVTDWRWRREGKCSQLSRAAGSSCACWVAPCVDLVGMDHMEGGDRSNEQEATKLSIPESLNMGANSCSQHRQAQSFINTLMVWIKQSVWPRVWEHQFQNRLRPADYRLGVWLGAGSWRPFYRMGAFTVPQIVVETLNELLCVKHVGSAWHTGLWAELTCKIYMLKSKLAVPRNITVFGDRSLKKWLS